MKPLMLQTMLWLAALGVAMTDSSQELLNVYDARGGVIGVRLRSEAKAAGVPVGAVNVLVVNNRGEVLLQRRPADKENGARWDKSVGGHVSAGESFDETARRECGEELFNDGASPRVRCLARADLERLREPAAGDASALEQGVLIGPLAQHLNLRDVRLAPQGGIRNVIYHVGVYAGRSDLSISGFDPQPSEIDDLAYFDPGAVDRMLLRGELAPNMAFVWLAYGLEVLRLAGR
jgi:isopentenyldiphosphate isomerase